MIIIDWILNFLVNRILYSYKPICRVIVDIIIENENISCEEEENNIKEYLKDSNSALYHYCFKLVHPEKIVRNPKIIDNILNLKENDKELKRFKENFYLYEKYSKYIKHVYVAFSYEYRDNHYLDIRRDLDIDLLSMNSLATDKDVELEYSIVKRFKELYVNDYSEDIDIYFFKSFKRLVFYISLLRRVNRDSILK